MRCWLVNTLLAASLLPISVWVVYQITAEPVLRPSIGSDKPLPIIDVENKIGTQVPLDAVLRDESGKPIRLGEATQGKPTLLIFGYYHCQQMCNMLQTRLLDVLNNLSYRVGRDFSVVTISIDPKESPQTAWSWREHYLKDYRWKPVAETDYRFLTAKEDEIHRLTEATGFRYEVIDKPLFQPVGSERKNKEYSHPEVVTVLRPDGVVTRYLFGEQWGATDVKLALIDSNGSLGDFTKDVVIKCFMSYDTHRGKYTFQVWKVMQVACMWTALMISFFVGRSFLFARKPVEVG